MDQEIQAAVDALRDDAKEASTYFVPSEEVRFEPVSMIVGFATALVVSYLAGFEKAAKREAEKAGESTFQWMLSLFRAKSRDSEKAAVEAKHVKAAKGLKKKLSKKDAEEALDKAEATLRKELKVKLGEPKAAALARKVRETAIREILDKG
jgi:hypothetical protein